jgi:hypothetical protein
MLIDLKKIKYYFLTMGNNDERKNHIVDLFKDYDITEVNPILNVPKTQSGSVGMGRMIELGLRNQDRTKAFQPFIILEDDVSFYREFPETLEIPDDSDLFYIGISKRGYKENYDCSTLIADDIKDDNTIVRIYNMLSCHGIMVCSALGASFYQRTMLESYYKNVIWDVRLAHMHNLYNVYALKKPLVYQDAKYRGEEEATKFELERYVGSKNQEFYKSDVSYAMYYKK